MSLNITKVTARIHRGLLRGFDVTRNRIMSDYDHAEEHIYAFESVITLQLKFIAGLPPTTEFPPLPSWLWAQTLMCRLSQAGIESGDDRYFLSIFAFGYASQLSLMINSVVQEIPDVSEEREVRGTNSNVV